MCILSVPVRQPCTLARAVALQMWFKPGVGHGPPSTTLQHPLPTQTPTEVTEGKPSGCKVDTVGLQLTAHSTEGKCEESERRLPGLAHIIF